MFLMMAVALYTSRVVLATLGVEDYGIYNVVGGVVTMFAFLNGTMSGVTQRFITYEIGTGNVQKLKEVFRTAQAIHWVIAVLILFLAETIGLWLVCKHLIIPIGRFYAAFWVYQFSILSVIIQVISIPYNACIIAHEKMSAFAYISILEVLLKLGIVFLLPIIGADKLIIYGFLVLLVQVVIRITYNEYCKKHFEEAQNKGNYNLEIAKKMLGFTSWSLFGGFASVGMNQGVNVILNIFFGPSVNAARAIAVQVDTAIYSFVQNFQMAIKPQIVKNYASGALQYMINLVYTSSKFSFYLLLALSLPIAFETSYILNLWLKVVPDFSVPFLQITILVALINTLATPLMTAANASGDIKKYQFICGTLQLALVPVSYIVLKFFPNPVLVFVAYFTISVIAQIARIIVVSNLIGLSPKDYLVKVCSPIIKVILIAPILPFIVHYSLNEGFWRLLLVIIVSFISVLIVVFCLGLSIQERNFIVKYFCKLKTKFNENHSHR